MIPLREKLPLKAQAEFARIKYEIGNRLWDLDNALYKMLQEEN